MLVSLTTVQFVHKNLFTLPNTNVNKFFHRLPICPLIATKLRKGWWKSSGIQFPHTLQYLLKPLLHVPGRVLHLLVHCQEEQNGCFLGTVIHPRVTL